MQKFLKNNADRLGDDDFGVLMWKLESIEKFFPCFNTMIKQK
jgi:hypothetical protein